MVAFLLSLLAAGIMTGVIVLYARRRPVGTPLTWGEAFAAGLFLFVLMFLLYGIIPHQWLAWADNELEWRSDNIGVPMGPFGKIPGMKSLLDLQDNKLFPEGVPLPNGVFILTAEVLRDIVAAGLYIVFLLAQIKGWLSWQKRGQKRPETPELTSAYGRPLVRNV
ncbi:MAG TPA: hypothetical protein VFO65_02185 [Acidimicrobiales bacterium]|nr:hypothetical protein [Acidimicrobiales bacterium]